MGDEIVLSWDLDNMRSLEYCIACFFAIEEYLKRESQNYVSRFGIQPQFKAGAHYGNVVAGEIGIIKRDITYSGDVLNTTARIQGMCNELESSFLISKDLFELHNKSHSHWDFEKKGEIPLKGKKEPMELLGVSLLH